MVNDTFYINIQSNSDLFKSNLIFPMINDTFYIKKQCRIFHVKTNRFNGNWYCLYQNIVKLKFLSVQVKSLLFNGKWYFLNQNVVKLPSFPVRSHLLNETFYIKKKIKFLSFQVKSHLFSGKWYFLYQNTSSTAQGSGGSFKNRKPIGEVGCCESRMAERTHWWTESWLELCFLEWLQWLQWPPYHNCWM